MKKTKTSNLVYSRKEITTIAQYSIWDFDQHLEHYPLASYLHLSAPKYYEEQPVKCWNEDINPSVPLGEIMQNDFERFQNQIRKIKELGCHFDFWGIGVCRKKEHGPGFELEKCSIPKEWHDWMLEEVGGLFVGWEIGEFDGVYGRDIIYYLPKEKIPKTRQEGYDKFMKYLHSLDDMVHNCSNSLCGVTYPHYFHEINTKMLGAEIGQGLLNTQVYLSFLRGASVQYDIPFRTISSSYDRWGMTSHNKNDVPTLQREDGSWVEFSMGPFDGHSDGMSKANWIISLLSGAKVIGQDYGIYGHPDESGLASLTSLGKDLLALKQWTENHWDIGSQNRPLALMLDYYSGWAPPRHLYSFKERVVWHCIPYGPCDFAMDQAFDLFYPGYTWAGYFRDERGFITQTPMGDCVDVLMNDASCEVMNNYPFIWLISDEDYRSDEAFWDRIKNYVEAGGHLIVSGKPLETIMSKYFDIKIQRQQAAICSFDNSCNEQIREAYYTVNEADDLIDSEILFQTESGLPVIIEKSLKQGKISCLMSLHGLTNELVAPGFDMWDFLKYKPDNSFELLNCVKRYLKKLIFDFSPIHIDGKDIYYSINEVNTEKFILCLYNPLHETWHGEVLINSKCNTKIEVTPVTGPFNWNAEINGTKITLPSNEILIAYINV